MKRLIVSIYGIRLLEALRGVPAVETHLVLSSSARRTILLETDHSVEQVEALADRAYCSSDTASAISSGSSCPAGIVLALCSMKTVSGIVTSFSDNLLLRIGEVIMPPMPAFYHRPATLGEVADQTVNRVLSMLGVELDVDLFLHWQGAPGTCSYTPDKGEH